MLWSQEKDHQQQPGGFHSRRKPSHPRGLASQMLFWGFNTKGHFPSLKHTSKGLEVAWCQNSLIVSTGVQTCHVWHGNRCLRQVSPETAQIGISSSKECALHVCSMKAKSIGWAPGKATCTNRTMGALNFQGVKNFLTTILSYPPMPHLGFHSDIWVKQHSATLFKSNHCHSLCAGHVYLLGAPWWLPEGLLCANLTAILPVTPVWVAGGVFVS